MRITTEEDIQQQRLLLSQLDDAWNRMKRPTVSTDLRNSLYTRMQEVEAGIGIMEEALRRRQASEKRASSRRRDTTSKRNNRVTATD